MFSITNKERPLKLFSNTHTFLSGSSLKEYEDNNHWHNLFRKQVTDRIDEDIFRPLFCNDNGAPNASIRVLISMMLLKEARGLSDSQLFEECRFNLLVRSALGLLNIDDSLPAVSTYYLLRKRIVDWEKSGNANLIEKVFSQVTHSQAIDFHVNGKSIRMDSKLIGSNIAWYSRYELIHETVRKAYSFIKAEQNRLSLCETERELLNEIAGESGEKVVYRSNKPEIESKMKVLGNIIYKITRQMSDHTSEFVQTLCKVFREQYIDSDNIITPRSKEEISAESIQSPYDTDCHYRNKDGNQVKGYSVNITETCDKDSLNLITDVKVAVSSTADCDFLQPAINSTQQVVTQKIETANADGAYHSPDNQDYCKENTIDFILGAIQGKSSRYDLSLDENNHLTVTDLQTNTLISSCKVEPRKKQDQPKWKIKNEKGQSRYFTQKDIDTCLLRKQITARTQKELNVRNNVEATIFQLAYHYPNDKSRYRGLIKHKIWANLRCLWINFVRIVKFTANNLLNNTQIVKNTTILYRFVINIIETVFLIYLVKNFHPNIQKNEI
jgi:hypothetical protein